MIIEQKLFFIYEGRTWEATLTGPDEHPEMVEVRAATKHREEWVLSDDLADLIRLPDLYAMQATATNVFKQDLKDWHDREIEARR
jgi:hypothetical protein